MKQQDKDINKVFSRRAFLIGAIQGALLTLLGARLAWLQLANGGKYTTLSDKNRINIKMLSPTRGVIYDRYGEPLAINEQNFRALVIPEQTENIEKSLSRLQKLIPLTQREIRAVIKKSRKSAKFIPLEIKDNLSWQDVAKIEVNLPDLPGVFIDVGEIRSYPLKEATAHILGYVGAVNKSELTGDPVLTLPGFKIGKTGLEKSYDKVLRGTAGTAEVEVNVAGREIRELSRSPGAPGKSLRLTIDSKLQEFTQRRLAQEKSASAVIMDVSSGAVYAMCSSPSFDPNQFTRRIAAETWEELLSNPGHPLNNKAAGGQYPPGSTFKMITALAAMEAGTINKHSSVNCPGHYDYGGNRFHCWKKDGHGKVDVRKALSESCDVYFYKIATEIGIERIAATARQMGLGKRFGFELKEERPGLIPNKNWKFGYFGEVWRPGETIVASIGQGYMQSTPLQLAVMTSRLVNGGYAVKPWITAFIGDQPGIDMTWPKINLRKSNLDILRQGMRDVVNDKNGTAYASRIEAPGMLMGGKTGTAQVRRITEQERLEGIKNKDMPWKLRHHALFVGYAPIINPKYACAIVVEHGGSGSVSAAPIARDLLLTTQQRNPASVRIHTNKANNKAKPFPTPEQKPSSVSRGR
jgi:penicillin-binding protein 2